MLKNLPWPEIKNSTEIVMGLERIEAITTKLGISEAALPPIIHLAGTNGKGSTLAFLKSIFEAAKYKVHAYTSPHLVHFNERITIAGKPIEDALILECLEAAKRASEGVEVTFFEGTTAAALLAFTKVKADVLLLETGLGGRLDATNIFAKPMLTVLTPVSMDHMDYLGNTLPEIAAEKAGIMKTGVPCVVSDQRLEAGFVVERVAKEKNVTLYRYGKEWNIEITTSGFNFVSSRSNHILPKPSLIGKHQYTNAATAVAVTDALQLIGAPFKFKKDDIREGLQKAEWPGRLQKLKTGKILKTVPEDTECWIDGGHNQAGGRVLGEQASEWQDKPLYLIVGMMKDKDSAAFLAPLTTHIMKCFTVAVPNISRSHSAEELANIAQKVGMRAVPSRNIAEAISEIVAEIMMPSRILICGSLALMGHILEENS